MTERKVSPRQLQFTSEEVERFGGNDDLNQIQVKVVSVNGDQNQLVDGKSQLQDKYITIASPNLININASISQKKRRRVTRACDECRKKKVKCDGQNPCIHCTVYSYRCTYDQPSKRNTSNLINNKKHTDTQSMGLLSNTNSREGSITPKNSLSKTNSNSSIASNSSRCKSSQNNSTDDLETNKAIEKYNFLLTDLFKQLPDSNNVDIKKFKELYKKNKNDRIHSHFTSVLNETLSEYQNYCNSANSHMPTGGTHTPITQYDVLENLDDSCQNRLEREIKIILPSKNVALHFIRCTWENCCVLLRFYHRPSFLKKLDNLYETDPEKYTEEQMRFLPLCYATIAVGILFSDSTQNRGLMPASTTPSMGNIVNNMFMHDSLHQSSVSDNFSSNLDNKPNDTNVKSSLIQDEGYRFFIAARKLIDMNNITDRYSIQTLILLFIFLQCSARLSTCYSYIGIALRSALKEGYHRKINPSNSNLNPIEIEMRKRIFFTIYKLDVYVNCMLGLPRSLSEDDIDQTLPIELSDENITATQYYPERQNDVLSSMCIANNHTKLFLILSEIVSKLYSIKGTNNIIAPDTMNKLEGRLQSWVDNLPQELKPGLSNVPPEYERANRLLHLSFLQIQLILYRPFIHYLSSNLTTPVNSITLERAVNSITVSRTVIKLAQVMMSQNLLTGSYWYGVYTIFFAVAGLLYYIQQVKPTNKEEAEEYYAIVKDVEIGRKLLLALKHTSAASSRTYHLLNKLFERLNLKTINLTKKQLHNNNDINSDLQRNTCNNANKISNSSTDLKNVSRFHTAMTGSLPVNRGIRGSHSNKLALENRGRQVGSDDIETVNQKTFGTNNFQKREPLDFAEVLLSIETKLPSTNNKNNNMEAQDTMNNKSLPFDSYIKDMFGELGLSYPENPSSETGN